MWLDQGLTTFTRPSQAPHLSAQYVSVLAFFSSSLSPPGAPGSSRFLFYLLSNKSRKHSSFFQQIPQADAHLPCLEHMPTAEPITEVRSRTVLIRQTWVFCPSGEGDWESGPGKRGGLSIGDVDPQGQAWLPERAWKLASTKNRYLPDAWGEKKKKNLRMNIHQ